MTTRKIVTEETLSNGWEAVFEDYERGDIVGRGRTPLDAIADLLKQSEG